MADPLPTASEAFVNGVPGTVHLVDMMGTMHAKHARGGKSDVVLVPAPSNDPNDPLNWSAVRKLFSTLSVSVYTICIGISSAALYSVFVPVATSTGLDINDLVSGTGYMFLMFGWGCLIWQPIALQYGKRPVYIFSLLASMAVLIWTPFTKSLGQWYANKILQGFFGAPIESLCEISVADVYFQHQRGTYLALYGLALGGSSSFGALIAGPINDNMGWEWVFYWCAIFCGAGAVFVFFFGEETNYDRQPVHVDIAIPLPDTAVTAPTARSSSQEPQVPDQSKGMVHSEEPPEDVSNGLTNYPTKSFWAKLKLFDKPRPNRLVANMLGPLKCFSLPVVCWAGFSYGTALVWSNLLNGTTSSIFSAAPYNFTATQVSLTYFASILGSILGSFYAGLFGDKVVLYLSRRNNGIVEAEHRLWMFLLYCVLVPGFLLLWGVGAARGISAGWLIFAACLGNAATSMGLALSVAYCIDSYKALSGNAMVTVILIRNTMSFAINYGITPWMVGMGLQNQFIVAAFAGLGQALTFLLMVRYGPWLRSVSKARYWRWVDQAEKSGFYH